MFSLPAPLGAMVMERRSPGTRRVWMMAGVLSPVFFRTISGSLSALLRRQPSM